MGLISRVSSRTYRKLTGWFLIKTCDVERFLTFIRKSRDIEDRIIYRLNDAVRTKSVSERSDLSGGSSCEGLKNELDAARVSRENSMRDCLAATEIAVSNYKQGLDEGKDGFRRGKLKAMMSDRHSLIADQKTESNTRARVDKVFREKCDI